MKTIKLLFIHCRLGIEWVARVSAYFGKFNSALRSISSPQRWHNTNETAKSVYYYYIIWRIPTTVQMISLLRIETRVYIMLTRALHNICENRRRLSIKCRLKMFINNRVRIIFKWLFMARSVVIVITEVISKKTKKKNSNDCRNL